MNSNAELYLNDDVTVNVNHSQTLGYEVAVSLFGVDPLLDVFDDTSHETLEQIELLLLRNI
jgi:hypothetical protein